MGDFNAIPSSYPYRLITEHGGMVDSWHEANGANIPQNPDSEQLTPEAAINTLGVTCDSPVNTWSKHFLKKSAHKKKYGDRLDYIFYAPSPQLQCLKSNVTLSDQIPGTEMSYSDHYGVCSVFKIYKKVTSGAVTRSHYTKLPLEVVDGILAILKNDQHVSQKSAKSLLRLLAVSLFAILALFVIIIALPTRFRLHDQGDIVTIIVTLFGGLLLIGSALVAPVALIVGFVFGHTEQRALLQFEKEMETLVSLIKTHSFPENDLITMNDDDMSTSGRRRCSSSKPVEDH
jgi:sphingomyelin phosphodiesterase 2